MVKTASPTISTTSTKSYVSFSQSHQTYPNLYKCARVYKAQVASILVIYQMKHTRNLGQNHILPMKVGGKVDLKYAQVYRQHKKKIQKNKNPRLMYELSIKKCLPFKTTQVTTCSSPKTPLPLTTKKKIHFIL